MRVRIEVLVAPQRGEPAAVRDADLSAHRVAALAMRELDEERHELREWRRSVVAPRRVEIRRPAAQQRDQAQLEARERWDDGVEADRIRDDGPHLGDQARGKE